MSYQREGEPVVFRAIITDVAYVNDGQAFVTLNRHEGDWCCTGPEFLIVTNPPAEPALAAAIGTPIDGDERVIRVDGREWADRDRAGKFIRLRTRDQTKRERA